MLPHVLGVMQRGSSLHKCVVSLKNQVSSDGQGPPPVPPLRREGKGGWMEWKVGIKEKEAREREVRHRNA